MKVKDIEYKRIDVKDVQETYLETAKKINDASSVEEVMMAREICVKQNVLLDTYYNLAFIRWSLDTKNEFYLNEKNYYEENLPLINEAKTEYIKSVINSKFIDKIEKLLPNSLLKIYKNELISSSPLISEELILESKLEDEYSNFLSGLLINFNGEEMPITILKKYMSCEDREVRKEAYNALGTALYCHSEFIDNNFDGLVKVRTKMAKKLGYNNFTELGYVRMNRVCYNQTDVENFRENIVKYIVPKITRIRNLVAEKLGIDNMMLYDYDAVFKNKEPKPIEGVDLVSVSGKKLYRAMSEETSKFYDFMLKNDAFDCYSKPNKWGGGYQTDLALFNQPFILANFNGTSADADVLTHEVGHAYASYVMSKLNKDKELSLPFMDIAETHSMSMEFLCWKNAELLFGADANRYKFKHLLDSFTFLSYGALIDAFQHEVYNNYEFSSVQRNEAFNNLEKIYRPYLSTKGIKYFEKGTRWQYQMHVFENPFYYIDYVFAQITSLNVLMASQNNYDKAFKTYNDFVSLGADYGYLEALKKVGLPSPLDEENIKNVANKIYDLLIETLDKL